MLTNSPAPWLLLGGDTPSATLCTATAAAAGEAAETAATVAGGVARVVAVEVVMVVEVGLMVALSWSWCFVRAGEVKVASFLQGEGWRGGDTNENGDNLKSFGLTFETLRAWQGVEHPIPPSLSGLSSSLQPCHHTNFSTEHFPFNAHSHEFIFRLCQGQVEFLGVLLSELPHNLLTSCLHWM